MAYRPQAFCFRQFSSLKWADFEQKNDNKAQPTPPVSMRSWWSFRTLIKAVKSTVSHDYFQGSLYSLPNVNTTVQWINPANFTTNPFFFFAWLAVGKIELAMLYRLRRADIDTQIACWKSSMRRRFVRPPLCSALDLNVLTPHSLSSWTTSTRTMAHQQRLISPKSRKSSAKSLLCKLRLTRLREDHK